MAAKLSANALIELAKNRRSIYTLSKNLPISTQRITEIVNQTTLETPSSFNSQSNRVVVLYGAEHDKLWDITADTLKAIRISGFKAAAGTVLFYVDNAAVEAMQTKFAIYADRFPPWAVQSAGIQQYLLWTALEAEGLGANLQHYNPLIDEKVAETWKIPSTWTLNAQLVFGAKTAEAAPKDYAPLEERVKVFGA
ncbi:Nitroreductase-like protein [Fusarium oxysporum]|nr:Nitroreductase-like protein [Fusarium oxysporum]